MNHVLEEAYEMVEDGFASEAEFRDFTFTNPVTLHAGMNPNFFKGTVVEDAVDKLLVEQGLTTSKTHDLAAEKSEGVSDLQSASGPSNGNVTSLPGMDLQSD